MYSQLPCKANAMQLAFCILFSQEDAYIPPPQGGAFWCPFCHLCFCTKPEGKMPSYAPTEACILK